MLHVVCKISFVILIQDSPPFPSTLNIESAFVEYLLLYSCREGRSPLSAAKVDTKCHNPKKLELLSLERNSQKYQRGVIKEEPYLTLSVLCSSPLTFTCLMNSDQIPNAFLCLGGLSTFQR